MAVYLRVQNGVQNGAILGLNRALQKGNMTLFMQDSRILGSRTLYSRVLEALEEGTLSLGLADLVGSRDHPRVAETMVPLIAARRCDIG